MRIVIPFVVLALGLAACGKDEATPAVGSKGGLTIKTDPTTLPVSKGKLAVLPKDMAAAPAAPAAPPPQAAAPTPAEPEEPAPPADLPPQPPADRWAGVSDPPQGSFPAEEEEERLVADCMDAQAEGHPFGWSAACRRVAPPR